MMPGPSAPCEPAWPEHDLEAPPFDSSELLEAALANFVHQQQAALIEFVHGLFKQAAVQGRSEDVRAPAPRCTGPQSAMASEARPLGSLLGPERHKVHLGHGGAVPPEVAAPSHVQASAARPFDVEPRAPGGAEFHEKGHRGAVAEKEVSGHGAVENAVVLFPNGVNERDGAADFKTEEEAARRPQINYSDSFSEIEPLPSDTWTASFIKSTKYEVTMLAVVAANSLFIGYQVERSSNLSVHEVELWEEVMEYMFVGLFTADVLIRLVVFRLAFFTSKIEKYWNLFDLFVVLAMLLLLVMDWLQNSLENISTVSGMRLLRVLRLVRTIRTVRALRAFKELRILVSCLVHCLSSVLWTAFILFIIFYIFGLMVTQGCIDFFMEDLDRVDMPEYEALRNQFGTLSRSMLSLFEGIAGGISWGELGNSLESLPPAYHWLFLVFTFFSLFALLNIVTGVFIEKALSRAQSDRQSKISEAQSARVEYITSMSQFFVEIDRDGSGTLTRKEFQAIIKDEQMIYFFHAHGLRCHDVELLFALLDLDGSGQVSIREFLAGCVRFSGEATGVDLAVVHFQVRWVMHHLIILAKRLSCCDSLKQGFKGWTAPKAPDWQDAASLITDHSSVSYHGPLIP